jgi:ribonucleotide reductase alpha subunit
LVENAASTDMISKKKHWKKKNENKNKNKNEKANLLMLYPKNSVTIAAEPLRVIVFLDACVVV